MAADGDSSGAIRKVAYCSAIVAGFAYVGYSMLRNALCVFGRPRRSKKNKNQALSDCSTASQTDLSLPSNLHVTNIWDDLNLQNKSVKERVKEMNLRARQFGDTLNLAHFQPRSLQNSPWNTPRVLSPVDVTQNGISRSADNINCSTPPESPQIRRMSILKAAQMVNDIDAQCCSRVDAVHCPLPSRDTEETHRKRLGSLYKKARVMTPQEARSVVALMITKNDDEDLVVRSLTTISNCAAFSTNQDLLCDAGCLPVLKEYLDSPSVAVQVATTQAIANLSANERNQGLLQTCICRLVERSTSKQCTELLRVSSLTALANLALFNANHMAMKAGISGFLRLLEDGTGTTRLQALKLLVNLSCNSAMLPYLMASRSSPQLYRYLSLKGDHDVTLRLVTFLANAIVAASKLHFKPRDLAGEHKPPYPETLYATIYGTHGKEVLRKKLAMLSNSHDEDITVQVKRIQMAVGV